MPRFRDGQRVRYTCPENPNFPSAKKFASMGKSGLVMHINARDEQGRIRPITGSVKLARVQSNGEEADYDFFPDGWLNEDEWPRGFQVPESQLVELDNPETVLPGVITDRQGNPIGGSNEKDQTD